MIVGGTGGRRPRVRRGGLAADSLLVAPRRPADALHRPRLPRLRNATWGWVIIFVFGAARCSCSRRRCARDVRLFGVAGFYAPVAHYLNAWFGTSVPRCAGRGRARAGRARDRRAQLRRGLADCGPRVRAARVRLKAVLRQVRRRTSRSRGRIAVLGVERTGDVGPSCAPPPCQSQRVDFHTDAPSRMLNGSRLIRLRKKPKYASAISSDDPFDSGRPRKHASAARPPRIGPAIRPARSARDCRACA